MVSTSSTNEQIARTLTSELPAAAPGEQVRLDGWVHRRRELAKITFLVVRDRTGLAQVVLPSGTPVPPEETPVTVTGTATPNEQAPGGVEVTEATVTALGEPADTPAVELWRPTLSTGLPTLLDHAATTWRHPAQKAKWELAAASLRGFRETLDAEGFTEVHSPKLVESATESGANVFTVDYFGRPAYLAQSPQFYKQQLVGVFERVYEIGPVFRAEPHDTVRHLAEYVSLDVELGFVEDHREVIACLRDVVAGMVDGIRAYAAPAVERLGLELPEVPAAFPILHFREALEIAGAPADEPDLSPAHERALGEWAKAEHDSDFVVVEGYPTAQPGLLHPSRPGGPALVARLRPDLPRHRAGQRRAAAASLRRLRGHPRAAGLSLRALRVVRRGVPTGHPTPRRLRDRAGALGRSAGRGAQHPRGHALPPRPAPAGAVGHRRRRMGRWPPTT